MCTEIQLIYKYKTSIIKLQVHAIWKISEKWQKITHNIKKKPYSFSKLFIIQREVTCVVLIC